MCQLTMTIFIWLQFRNFTQLTPKIGHTAFQSICRIVLLFSHCSQHINAQCMMNGKGVNLTMIGVNKSLMCFNHVTFQQICLLSFMTFRVQNYVLAKVSGEINSQLSLVHVIFTFVFNYVLLKAEIATELICFPAEKVFTFSLNPSGQLQSYEPTVSVHKSVD